jgi:hypothetical protein
MAEEYSVLDYNSMPSFSIMQLSVVHIIALLTRFLGLGEENNKTQDRVQACQMKLACISLIYSIGHQIEHCL